MKRRPVNPTDMKSLTVWLLIHALFNGMEERIYHLKKDVYGELIGLVSWSALSLYFLTSIFVSGSLSVCEAMLCCVNLTRIWKNQQRPCFGAWLGSSSDTSGTQTHAHAEICYLMLSSLDSILSDKGYSLARWEEGELAAHMMITLSKWYCSVKGWPYSTGPMLWFLTD